MVVCERICMHWGVVGTCGAFVCVYVCMCVCVCVAQHGTALESDFIF